MSVLKIVKNVKEIHPKEIIFVKLGEFYHVYGKDAYILCFIMKYKMKVLEEQNMKFVTCGFPSKSLNKVEAILENKKINYMILDRRNGYETDEYINFKNLNCYEKEYKKSYNYINAKQKLDKIYDILLQNIEDKETQKLLQAIENRLNI